MWRIDSFIEFRLMLKMPGECPFVMIEFRVIADITRTTKILTFFVWFNPKIINEYLLNLSIAIGILVDIVVVCMDDYLQSITAWTLETTIGTAHPITVCLYPVKFVLGHVMARHILDAVAATEVHSHQRADYLAVLVAEGGAAKTRHLIDNRAYVADQ